MRLLVVEDDHLLNNTLCYNLSAAGYTVDAAVIFLTANDMESDMLKGFELGADDYVTKPFPISVFRKKASALLPASRSRPAAIATQTVHYPSILRN